MEEGCLPKCIKGLLIVSNNLVILMGVIVFGFGIFALTDGKDLAKLVDWGSAASGTDLSVALYSTASVVLITVSILAIVVAFLGCCGAIKENRCMLFSYYILLLVLFMGVVIGGTIALSQSLYVIRSPLKESMQLYDPAKAASSSDPKFQEATQAWDDIQEAYDCCGVDSFGDWTSVNATIFPTKEGFKVPDSCCSAFVTQVKGVKGGRGGLGSFEDCLRNPDNIKYSDSMEGCLPTLSQSLESSRKNVGIVTGAITAFMFINLVTLFLFAMHLNPRTGYQMV